MTLYRPGAGTGRAWHVRRVRALQALEKAGLIDYAAYDRTRGYVLTTAAGEAREVGAGEVGAYVAGMLDLYCSMRQDVDATAGEDALDALDDRYLDVLTEALATVLPLGEES